MEITNLRHALSCRLPLFREWDSRQERIPAITHLARNVASEGIASRIVIFFCKDRKKQVILQK